MHRDDVAASCGPFGDPSEKGSGHSVRRVGHERGWKVIAAAAPARGVRHEAGSCSFTGIFENGGVGESDSIASETTSVFFAGASVGLERARRIVERQAAAPFALAEQLEKEASIE